MPCEPTLLISLINGKPVDVDVSIEEFSADSYKDCVFLVDGSLTGNQVLFKKSGPSSAIPYGYISSGIDRLHVFADGVYGTYIVKNPNWVRITSAS
jgi:hypothetical protein